MKIIKKGNLELLRRPLIFHCSTCGCVFEADNTEYTWTFSQREGCGWYSVECPYCKKKINVDDDKVEEKERDEYM